MKKILGLFLFLSSFAFAEITFAKDYQSALSQATKEGKKIMLMLTAEGCQACWWMKHVAFKDEDLKKKIEDHFVSVEVDVNKQKIPMGLEYIGTPTFYFLTSDQDQLSRIDGARKPQEFTKLVDFLIK